MAGTDYLEELIEGLDLEDITDGDCFDPECNPSSPKVISFQDITAASFRIRGGVRKTSCVKSSCLSKMFGMELWFKKEMEQVTGSFKERGARYTLLSLDEASKSKGVIASSAGNHALALAYHGQQLGIPVTVVMPIIAPLMKIKSCRDYGANVILKGTDIGEAKKYAMYIGKRKDLVYINGYDHPKILAGAGTTGIEIMESVENLDAVIIPVGGGGLVAGTALAIKTLNPKVLVIGVEATNCPSFAHAREKGAPSYKASVPSLADGLAVPTVGVNAFATADPLIDELITVSENSIALAILRLIEIEKCVVEGAGATGLAAVLEGQVDFLKGKRVAIPLCGGNIDTTVLGRCLDRGLAEDGRLVSFKVLVSDRPGGLAEVTRMITSLGISIKDIYHERAWIKTDIYSVHVKCVVETHDADHARTLHKALSEDYELVAWSLPDIQ